MLLGEISAPMDPAEDAAQTASASIPGCDAAVHPRARELRILAAIPLADDLFGPPGQFERIERRKARLQVSRIAPKEFVRTIGHVIAPATHTYEPPSVYHNHLCPINQTPPRIPATQSSNVKGSLPGSHEATRCGIQVLFRLQHAAPTIWIRRRIWYISDQLDLPQACRMRQNTV